VHGCYRMADGLAGRRNVLRTAICALVLHCAGLPGLHGSSACCLLGPYREAPGRGQGWGNVLRLFGGGSELDEEGLPDVEFKLGENSLAFNVSLRCPFPVWRSVAAHFMREHAPLV
jgi:hypothetical protein